MTITSCPPEEVILSVHRVESHRNVDQEPRSAVAHQTPWKPVSWVPMVSFVSAVVLSVALLIKVSV